MSADISSNNKRIAKNTLLLYFRMLFMMVISLYTSRLVLVILGIEDFGIYGIVGGVVSMFAFLNGVMSGVTQRYVTFALGKGNTEVTCTVFCTSINIHALLSVFIFIMAETAGLWFLNVELVIPANRLVAANWVYQFSVLSVIIMFISSPYNAILIAHEKMSAFAYISVLEAVFKLFIIYLLLIGHVDKLILYAFLILIIQFIIRIIYGRYCNKYFVESHYKFVYDKAIFKEMLSFASWNLFGGIASISCTQGVNIILNMFFGPTVNAARAVAVQVQNAVIGFVSNFQMALNPQIVKNYASNKYDEMFALIFASSRYSFFLLFLISLPVILEINPLLHFWLEEIPDHTANFISLMLCIMMIETLANPMMTAIQATGIIRRYQVIVSLILILIIPISWFVLEEGKGAESVFVIQFFITIIAQIIRVLLIRKLVPFSLYKYLKEVVFKIILVAIPASFLSIGISHFFYEKSLYDVIGMCSLSILSTLLCIIIFGLNKVERSLVGMKMRNFIKKSEYK